MTRKEDDQGPCANFKTLMLVHQAWKGNHRLVEAMYSKRLLAIPCLRLQKAKENYKQVDVIFQIHNKIS